MWNSLGVDGTRKIKDIRSSCGEATVGKLEDMWNSFEEDGARKMKHIWSSFREDAESITICMLQGLQNSR
jgi:hypothetical protein